jgi:hypothetical protein
MPVKLAVRIPRLLPSWLALCFVSCTNTVALKGDDGPPGSKGDPGKNGSNGVASINRISPEEALAGRPTTIEIAGDRTGWTQQATVDFGEDITIKGIDAPSGELLRVDIDVSPMAKRGPRDITVTQDDVTLSFNQVFTVTDLQTIEVMGSANRGTVVLVRLTNHEPGFSFDSSFATVTYDSYHGPQLGFTGIVADASAIGMTRVARVTTNVVDVWLGIDLEASLGPADFTLIQHPGQADQRTLAFPGLIAVRDNAERLSMVGTTVNFTPDQAFGSKLIRVEPGTLDVEYLATVTAPLGMGAAPMVFPLPEGESRWFSAYYLELQNGFLFVPLYSNSSRRFVVIDPSGQEGTMLTFNIVSVPKGVEAEPNDSLGSASMAMGPVAMTGGLSSPSEEDWYRVPMTADDFGRTVHLRTRCPRAIPDYQCAAHTGDELLQVYTPTGGKVATSSDIDLHEDLRVTIPDAGDVLVRLLAGHSGVDGGTSYPTAYELVVNVE